MVGDRAQFTTLDPFKQLSPCLVKAMPVPAAVLKLSHLDIFSAASCCTSFELVLLLCQMVQSLKSHFTYTEVICFRTGGHQILYFTSLQIDKEFSPFKKVLRYHIVVLQNT